MVSSSRATLFGVLVTAVFAACTLIDPLDDISSGSGAKRSSSKDGSAASSTSGSTSSSSTGGVGDDDDATGTSSSSSSTSSSSGTSGFACNGPREVEPNETTGNPLASPECCGSVSADDLVDRWTFTNDTGGELSVQFRVDAPSPIQVNIQAGSNILAGSAGSTQTSNLPAGAKVLLQITPKTTGTIPYRISFATN